MNPVQKYNKALVELKAMATPPSQSESLKKRPISVFSNKERLIDEVTDRVLSQPEVDEKAQAYVYSEESSPDLKAYVAGQNHGEVSGHDTGFSKGLIIGGALTLIGLVFLSTRL